MTDHDAKGFSVLFVCTGNVCRSPVAELVARRLLADKLGPEEAARFAVSSAGTSAAVGEPMDPLSRAELADVGLVGDEASSFRSRPVTAEAIQAADLILTADRNHRSTVVQLAPGALGKTFCLREFARLLSSLDLADLPDDPVARARASVAAVRAGRGLIPPVPREQEEVVDPLGCDQAVHHKAVLLIFTALAQILGVPLPAGVGTGRRWSRPLQGRRRSRAAEAHGAEGVSSTPAADSVSYAFPTGLVREDVTPQQDGSPTTDPPSSGHGSDTVQLEPLRAVRGRTTASVPPYPQSTGVTLPAGAPDVRIDDLRSAKPASAERAPSPSRLEKPSDAPPSTGIDSATPPRPPVAPGLPPSEAAAVRRPERPRVVDVAHGFWMLSCLAGVITAALSLRHFDEYRAVLLAITQRDYPTETAATQEQVATAAVGVLLGAGVLVVVLQMVFSLAMRSGRNWARFVLVLIGGVGLFYAFLVVNSVSFDIKVGIGAAAGLAVVGVLAMFLPGTGKWFERDRGRINPPVRQG